MGSLSGHQCAGALHPGPPCTRARHPGALRQVRSHASMPKGSPARSRSSLAMESILQLAHSAHNTKRCRSAIEEQHVNAMAGEMGRTRQCRHQGRCGGKSLGGAGREGDATKRVADMCQPSIEQAKAISLADGYCSISNGSGIQARQNTWEERERPNWLVGAREAFAPSITVKTSSSSGQRGQALQRRGSVGEEVRPPDKLYSDAAPSAMRMNNEFNSQEWSLPGASTMKELEKPVSPAVTASCHQHPTEDPEVQEVDKSAVTNNKKKKKVSQRGKAFSKEEDRAICSTFLHVSTDPIIGTNQSAAGYYARMHQHFTENIGASSRTKISIENRWTTIQKAVSKFCGFYAAIERRNESGKNEQDRINDSIRMYEDTEPWQFHHCWVVLRGEPKWHEKMAETNMGQKANQKHSQDSETEINSMHTGSALPERPEGRDSAMKRSRMMGYTSSSSTAVEMLQKMHERGEKNDEKED
ncbi:hypothetical protein PAHAL_1G138800 [Panicum hallii]|uniref:Uncharacterized protein n=1 Tax=Panicum hallii TaxID=206008 RepID=A0A2S3GPJ4_9POAL|nr:uncharacterized protein LOC112881504 isoform X2 [Panicum hallii]PAN05925.1 hypothetical protein PAHAL_1G138800 [Panicum hallii]